MFEEEPLVSWYEGALPESLFVHELLLAGGRIADGLRDRGLPLAELCYATPDGRQRLFELAAG